MSFISEFSFFLLIRNLNTLQYVLLFRCLLNRLRLCCQVTFESDEELDPEEAARVALMQQKQAEAVKKFEVEEDLVSRIWD